jgi:hypothetical protein
MVLLPSDTSARDFRGHSIAKQALFKPAKQDDARSDRAYACNTEEYPCLVLRASPDSPDTTKQDDE